METIYRRIDTLSREKPSTGKNLFTWGAIERATLVFRGGESNDVSIYRLDVRKNAVDLL